ncbi:MAG: hypothetical protein ACLFUI_08470 [Halanaerobiales bacterium]
MKNICISLIIILLSSGTVSSSVTSVSASAPAPSTPAVHTPWNSDIFEDTWQEETVIKMQGWSSWGRELLNGWFGKKLKKGHMNREKALQKRISEKMKESDPLWNTILYEDWPHRLNDYRELEKLAKDWRDLDALIEHIEKQNHKVKNKFAQKKFEDYIDDLEHIRDYQKKVEEGKMLQSQTVMTITLAILGALAGLAGAASGVGA